MEIIRGKQTKPVKVCIYGPAGIGKSTFASQFPNALFIDTEDSTVTMDVARFPRPSSWTMLLAQVEHVRRNPDICKTLIIDTADWAERLCIEHICAKAQVDGLEGFGWGKGYTYLEEEFGRLLNRLQDLIETGINIVVTAHAEIKKIEQPEEIGGFDHWQMKLERKTMPLLKEWADVLLFANYKTHVINVDNQGAQKGKNKAQGGKRVMYTSHKPWWDAKNRHGLPEELPFEYKAIVHIIPTDITTTAPEAQVSEAPKETEPTEQPTKTEKEPVKEQPTEAPKEPDASWDSKSNLKDKLKNVYKPLADLMLQNNVTIEEIQMVVAQKGHFPADTPMENYPMDYVDGVLIGAWSQVFEAIQQLRQAELPF